jgi:hypothetical protein
VLLLEKNDPENEIGTGDNERGLNRYEAIALLVALLLLLALLWVLIDVSPGFL